MNRVLNQLEPDLNPPAGRAARTRMLPPRNVVRQINGPAAPPPPLEPLDPRWVVAIAAARTLEGGRAAIMPVEGRQRVTSLALSLGLRTFDASLVIAIVQDACRRGEPLGSEALPRLALVPGPVPAPTHTPAVLLGASLLLAMGILALLMLLAGPPSAGV